MSNQTTLFSFSPSFGARFRAINGTNYLRKVVRTLQVNFPYLQDLKFAFYRNYRRLFSIPCEEDFYALDSIRGADRMLYLDIGANRGETIQAIIFRAPKGNVIGFEPNPIVFDKLKRTYRNDPKVQLYNMGLGEESTSLELNIPFYKKFMFDGLASFNAEEALGWLKTRIFFFNNQDLSLRKIKCKIVPLDNFKLDADFIKIDVQGYEYNVLLGGKETISRRKPILLIETPKPDATKFLEDLGYRAYRYDRGEGFRPGFGSLNTFFFHSEKVQRQILD